SCYRFGFLLTRRLRRARFAPSCCSRGLNSLRLQDNALRIRSSPIHLIGESLLRIRPTHYGVEACSIRAAALQSEGQRRKRFAISPSRSSKKSRDREDALASTRDACATQMNADQGHEGVAGVHSHGAAITAANES